MSELIRPEFDPPASRFWVYARLMRLPNVFTAMADIVMGYLFVHAWGEVSGNWAALLLLVVASSCLYTAGMVLNDVYDVEIDARERPFRPLPSGQVPLRTAWRLGMALLLLGVFLGAAAGWMHVPRFVAPWRSGIVAALLALAIVAYDRWLKHTPVGPLGMGLCRLLNVLLGMSAAGYATPPEESWLSYHYASWLVAGGIGVYITGVTWFARSEASQSNRGQLTAAFLVLLAGIAMLACLPLVRDADRPLRLPQPELSFLLFGLLAMPILRRGFMAIQDPEPANVQGMVKQCLLSLILLDAAVVLLTTGPLPALAVIALIVPMLSLGRWVYST